MINEDEIITADLRKFIYNAMRDVFLSFDGTTQMPELKDLNKDHDWLSEGF